MPDFNCVHLMGRLVAEPECKFTPKGTAIGGIRLAINREWKDVNGTKQEEVTYVICKLWGVQAETTKQYLHKGSPVFVEGRLNLEQWETSEGEKRQALVVVAERVQFLGSPKQDNARQESPSAPPKSEAFYSNRKTVDEDGSDIPF